jgi:hypothetical protein
MKYCWRDGSQEYVNREFKQNIFLNLEPECVKAVVAERLRRLIRYQIPSGSIGSNPTDCGYVLS